jgi:predicted RNase H-like HicB family nuclease
MSGAASEWRPIALTAKIYREGDQYVAHCVELDIASCGDTEEEAFENLVDASDVYVTTLEETGQIERVFAERGIKVGVTPEQEAATVKTYTTKARAST